MQPQDHKADNFVEEDAGEVLSSDNDQHSSRHDSWHLSARRAEEFRIIAKYDSLTIRRGECWFLIDASWVEQWSAFIRGASDEPPGRVSNLNLLMPAPEGGGSSFAVTEPGAWAGGSSGEADLLGHHTEIDTGAAGSPGSPGGAPKSSGAAKNSPSRISMEQYRVTSEEKPTARMVPRPGLQRVHHYRGVNPVVWCLYRELYGTDAAPPICRYDVDIYAPQASLKHQLESLEGPMLKARMEISCMQARLNPQETFDVDEDLLWGCCRRSRIDAILFRLFTCCRSRVQTFRYKRVQSNASADEEREVHGSESVDKNVEDKSVSRNNGRDSGRQSAAHQNEHFIAEV